jgi:hypothetical protein
VSDLRDYEIAKIKKVIKPKFEHEVAEKLMKGRRKPIEDWHPKRGKKEPDCGADQWRRRDRNDVINMCDMSNDHFRHAYRFAMMYRQHKSRLPGMIRELKRRSK